MPQIPKQIVMLAYDKAQLLDVTGPMQILSAVNDARPRGTPGYALTLLAESCGAFATSSGVRLVADGDYSDLPAQIDTLMAAGGEGIDAALRNPHLRAAPRSIAPASGVPARPSVSNPIHRA